MSISREAILFLEGVIVGVYGNWLISYADKIQAHLSSVQTTANAQSILVAFSFVFFVGFATFMFLEGKIVGLIICGALHVGLLYSAQLIGSQEFSYPMLMQFVMGLALLVFLCFLDMQRKRISPRGYGKVL